MLPESYHALGQDGLRFNGSIVSPNNSAVPADVANSLYNMSDHLPIITDFMINATTDVADVKLDFQWKVMNPIRDHLDVMIQTEEAGMFTFDVFSVEGNRLTTYNNYIEQC